MEEKDNLVNNMFDTVLDHVSEMAQRRVKREIGEENWNDYKEVAIEVDTKMYTGKKTLKSGVRELLERLRGKGIVNTEEEFIELYDTFSKDREINDIEDVVEKERDTANMLDKIQVMMGIDVEELVRKMHGE